MAEAWDDLILVGNGATVNMYALWKAHGVTFLDEAEPQPA